MIPEHELPPTRLPEAATTPATQTSAPAASAETDPATKVAAEPESDRRRTGKIACKTKAVRDKINVMLQDGFTYAQVINALGDDGADLNEQNVSNWKLGGYQDWLQQQEALADWRDKWEFAQDLVGQDKGLTIHQVVNQMVTSHIHEAICGLGPDALQKALKDNPRDIISLIRAIPSLAAAELNCERFRHHEAADKAKLLADKEGPKIITPETIKEIEHRLNLL